VATAAGADQSRFESQVEAPDGVKPTVVVKEPGSHAAPLLAEPFPAAKLIFLLRDGRDVVDSRPGAWRENLLAAEQEAMHEALGEALEDIRLRERGSRADAQV